MEPKKAAYLLPVSPVQTNFRAGNLFLGLATALYHQSCNIGETTIFLLEFY